MKSCETKERQEDAVLLVYTMKHSRQGFEQENI